MAVVAQQPPPPPPQPAPKQEWNWEYFKTPPGQLRAIEVVLCLLALICTAESYCVNDSGRHAYTLFVIIMTMLKSSIIGLLFVLGYDSKIKFVDIPLTLLLNDGIMLIVYFITSTLSLLAIGRCYAKVAGVFAALFLLGIFLVLVGLVYLNYQKWSERFTNGESAKNSGTTITESSPTVLQ